MIDEPVVIKQPLIPNQVKAIIAIAVAGIAGMGVVAWYVNHDLDGRRDANCKIWEHVLNLSDQRDSQEIKDFVVFLGELGCDVDVDVGP